VRVLGDGLCRRKALGMLLNAFYAEQFGADGLVETIQCNWRRLVLVWGWNVRFATHGGNSCLGYPDLRQF
jgi:hypothetical protein